VSFLAAAGLGLGIWSGHFLGLIRFHMALGALFALTLFALATLSGFRGASLRRVVTLLALSVAVFALGIAQTNLMPGSWHWLVRLFHFGLGIAAVRQGLALAVGLGAKAALPAAKGPASIN